jgi:hypothetical protein
MDPTFTKQHVIMAILSIQRQFRTCGSKELRENLPKAAARHLLKDLQGDGAKVEAIGLCMQGCGEEGDYACPRCMSSICSTCFQPHTASFLCTVCKKVNISKRACRLKDNKLIYLETQQVRIVKRLNPPCNNPPSLCVHFSHTNKLKGRTE